MFHVHSDKRTQRSASKIARAVNDLIDQRAFTDITIADVQRRTGVARTTFYRSFDNLVDVLEWECDHYFHQLFQKFSGASRFPSERLALQTYLAFWGRHPQVLAHLVQAGRTDVIYCCQGKYARQMQSEYGPLAGLPPQERVYFINVRVDFVLSILLTWIRTGQKESIAELVQIADHQVRYLVDQW